VIAAGGPEYFTFEAFVAISDKCRKLSTQQKRQRAGFTEEEISTMRNLFAKRCKPGSKELEKGEFLWLLMDLDMEISTLKERRKIFQDLDKARENALEAGIADADVGATGSPTSFWVFVHFMAASRCEALEERMHQEDKAIDKARFSKSEVQEFSELFTHWVQKETFVAHEDDDDENGLPPAQGIWNNRQFSDPPVTNGRRSSLPNAMPDGALDSAQQPRTDKRSQSHMTTSEKKPKARLSIKGLLLLLASINIEINPQQRIELDSKIRQMNAKREHTVDFPTFLLIMRWMMDTNFADVNGTAQQVVDRMKQGMNPSFSPTPSDSCLKARRRSV
jgi:hypothetical protein